MLYYIKALHRNKFEIPFVKWLSFIASEIQSHSKYGLTLRGIRAECKAQRIRSALWNPVRKIKFLEMNKCITFIKQLYFVYFWKHNQTTLKRRRLKAEQKPTAIPGLALPFRSPLLRDFHRTAACGDPKVLDTYRNDGVVQIKLNSALLIKWCNLFLRKEFEDASNCTSGQTCSKGFFPQKENYF